MQTGSSQRSGVRDCGNQRTFKLGLLELGESFKQSMKDFLTAWLVRLWDVPADRISLSAAEAEEWKDITTHPCLGHKLLSLRQYKEPGLALRSH